APQSAIIRSPLVVSPQTSVMETIVHLSKLHHDDPHLNARSSCVIVVDHDQVIGLVTRRDLVRLIAQQQPLEHLWVHQVMRHPVITLHERAFTDVLSAIHLLQQHHIHQLPLVDDCDRLVGLVTDDSLQPLSCLIDLLRLRSVSEAMTTTVTSAPPQSTIATIAQLMIDRTISSVVIVDFLTDPASGIPIPVGIVTEHDLVQWQALGLNLATCPVQTVISSPVVTVAPTDSLLAVHQLMEQHHIQQVVVTGSQEELVGLVTQRNLWQASNPLELYRSMKLLESKVDQLEAEKSALLTNRNLEAELEKCKRIEQRLLASEQRYAALAAIAPVGIFRTDATGFCTYVNERYCQITGLTQAAALRNEWHQRLHPDDRDRTVTAWEQCVQGIHPFAMEYRFQRQDGSSVWVYGQSAAEYDSQGQIVGHIGTITDITARKQAERALHESEQTNRAIVEALPDLLIQMDRHGHYSRMIAGSTVRVRYPPPEQEHPTVYDVMSPELAQQRLYYTQQALDTGSLQVYEQAVVVDHETRYEEVRITPLTSDEVLVIVRDITDRKRAELTLQKILTGTAAVIGDDFFAALVQHLAETLNVQYACVAELKDDGLQTLAFWANGILESQIIYPILNTPCQQVLEQGEFYCEQHLQQCFPKDTDLATMQAESYLGIALTDTQGQLLGNLFIMDVKPLSEAQRIEISAVLRALAGRTAAELQRKTATEELIRLNQSLEASEAKYRLLVEHQTDLIIKVDPDNHLVFVSPSYCELFGKTDAELLNQPYLPVVHEDDQERTAKAYSLLHQPPYVCYLEHRTMTKDGWRWLGWSFKAILNADAQVVGMVGVGRDITQLKQTQQALQQLNQFLELKVEERTAELRDRERQIRAIVEAIPDLLLRVTRDGRCIDYVHSANQGDQFLPIHQHLAEVLPLELLQQQLQMIERAIATGRLQVYEHQVQKHDRLAYEEIRVVAISPEEALVIVRDITERKQTEAQLRHSNEQLMRATRLKDEFLANMSHELRTPLNAILGMTEGLLEETFGSITLDQRRALQTIERSGNHLLELINDILDLAKIEAGQLDIHLAPVSIANLCHASLTFVSTQAAKKGIRLVTNLPPQLPELLVDERRIRQVLINLLTNAVKFTPHGGQVTIEVSLQSTAPDADWLRIAVIDTGIGIPPKHLQHLFQPFVQIDSALNRKYEGTGLGLALVKRLVDLHGGVVGVTSEVGVGSCFTIDLPYKPAATPSSPQVLTDNANRSVTQQPPIMMPLVLLAEDNEANISTMSSYLNAKGYRLLLAKNGREAIALAQTQHPDIILMDIHMPELDGLAAIAQIRQQPALATVPIIALTGLAMEHDRDRCLAAGATDYLSKPVKLKQLVGIIQRLLETATSP
ncbi:MAG: PAS domain S-box protein, partial [Cyanobacteriota bacterium SKYGB_h_bin112]|nr:PAS domain S-box protein [Cyanobacteriota bacterium SKYGB_h_bin112]